MVEEIDPAKLKGIEKDIWDEFAKPEAEALITKFDAMASALEENAGTWTGKAHHAETDWRGQAHATFVQRYGQGDTDRRELVTALKDAAQDVRSMVQAAQQEQNRRLKAREWKRKYDEHKAKEKNRGGLSGAWDNVKDFFSEDDPMPPEPEYPEPPPNLTSQPGATVRSEGHHTTAAESTTVVSARVDNLKTAAGDWNGMNRTYKEKRSTLATAEKTFRDTNKWGQFAALTLLTNAEHWTIYNDHDVTFLKAVAAGFEAVDSNPGGVSYSTDVNIRAFLIGAGFTGNMERTDITVSYATARGGPMSTGFAIDPVSTASGNFFETELDLEFGSLAGWLQVRRAYNSLDGSVGPHGPGWSSWASTRLKLSDNGQWARLRGPDGQIAQIPMPYGKTPGFEGRIQILSSDDGPSEDADSPRLVARFDQENLAWYFDEQGRPVLIDQGTGSRVELSWEGEHLVAMAHEWGRSLSFEWSGERIVAAVADDGRRVTYTYDDSGRLVHVDAPAGARRYEWDVHDRIAAVTDADGVVEARNTYDQTGRVTTQETAAGRRARFWYREGLVTEVDDDSGGPLNTWIHDENARLVKLVDGHGEAVNKAYDDKGNVIRVTDRRRASTQYEWDAHGNCTRIEYPTGVVVEMAYDERHRCIQATGPNRATTRFSYDGDNRHPSVIEDPEGGVTQLEVVDNLIKQVTDPDGITVGFDHDDQGRVVAVTDGTGATLRTEWHPNGRVAASVSPLGHRTEYDCDDAGRLLAHRGPDGSETRFERTAAGRVTAVVHPDGARQGYVHGADGEVAQTVDPTGAATSYRRNESGSIVSEVLPDGGKWTFDYDALLRVVGVTDPGGATWLREYDVEGELIGTVTPAGVHRKVSVDPIGMIRKVDDGLATVGFEYDSAGRAVAQVRPDGTEARAAYDKCGRIIAITEPSGGVNRFEYSPGGRLVAMVGPTGARTTYDYDPAGRLREVVLPNGGRQRIRYDQDGHVVRVTSATGEITRYSYDAAGRPLAVTAPNGGVIRYAHDAAGRLVSETSADGSVTAYRFDPAGRVTTVVDPNGGETQFERDVIGRVIAQTDPLGARYTQVVDPMGRPVQTVDAIGRTTYYTYDQGGRLVSRVDPDQSRHWWRWDDSDRLAAWGVDGTETELRRDLMGRVVEVVRDGEVALERSWDPDGNLVSETTPTHSIRWERDLVGNVVATTLHVNGFEPVTTRYELDAAGRIATVDDPATGRITIERDLAGRPVSVTGPGMREERSWTGSYLTSWTRSIDGQPTISVRYTRDQTGRIVHEQHGDGRSIRYGYDAAGQLIAIDNDEGSWRFDWDAAGRLVHEDTPAGERSYEYDAAGQLLGVTRPDGETRYEWDACGRRTAEAGPNGERHYHWNALGRLERIHSTAPDGSVSTRQLSYDPLGRLSGVDDTSLVWDAGEALDRLTAVGDRRLVGAMGTTWAIADSTGAATWLPGNARGEPAGLDAWGTNHSNGSQPTPAFPALAGGLGLGHRGELDIDGLTWLRNRAYDPTTRSFLSPDPLPGVAGSPSGSNTYHYAGNDPVGHADPLGLRQVTDEELSKVRENWNDGVWDRYGGYIAAGAMIAAGIGLQFIPGVGTVIGGAIIGAAIAGAISSSTQQYFNGSVNWGQVGIDAAIGAVGGGAGAATAVATKGMSLGARYGIRAAVDIGVNTTGGMGSRAMSGQDPFDPQAIAIDVTTGGVSSAAGTSVDAIRASRAAQRRLDDIAAEIRGAGKSPQSISMRTIAVGEDVNGDLHAGSSRGFDAGQREAADRLGVNRVPSRKGPYTGTEKMHAEENLLEAERRGDIPELKRVGTAKRDPCGPSEHNCDQQLRDRGIEIENDNPR